MLGLEDLRRIARSVYIAPADVRLPPLRLSWSDEAAGGRENLYRGDGYAYKVLVYPNVRWVEVVVDVWSRGERALLYARFTSAENVNADEIEEAIRALVESALRRGKGTLIEKLRVARSAILGSTILAGHGG